jgi:hypothetical protein
MARTPEDKALKMLATTIAPTCKKLAKEELAFLKSLRRDII